jgi:DNA-binding response OmpR family regulator
MVVEDEPDIYEVLLAMFEMWGIDGVAFVDGEDAVKWIEDVDSGRFRGELPELALLDIRLPGNISGTGVAKRLRNSEKLSDIAIVLNTAYKLNTEEQDKVMEEAQADELMYKPLPKFNELQARLEAVIAERRAQRKAVENASTDPESPQEDRPKPEPSTADSPTKTTTPVSTTTSNNVKRKTPGTARRKPTSVRKRRNSKA